MAFHALPSMLAIAAVTVLVIRAVTENQVEEIVQLGSLGQPEHRDQAGVDTRLGSSKTGRMG